MTSPFLYIVSILVSQSLFKNLLKIVIVFSIYSMSTLVCYVSEKSNRKIFFQALYINSKKTQKKTKLSSKEKS